MNITNLKELKEALCKVPNSVLKEYIVFNDGENENPLAIGISLAGIDDPKIDEEEVAFKKVKEYGKKYPILSDIGNFFDLAGKEAQNEDSDGYPVEYIKKKAKAQHKKK